ncbi:hypothetical protein VKT23_013073 [Stygiomarasmius scandens]|uniref:Helitron helicase-like domain-containing protein n=1 Tax=Marasmiellus scandens TaxID=2682957 RepID=A0ABR1J5P4_9AGAR
MLQRHAILLHTSLKCKRSNFANIATTFAAASAETIATVVENLKTGNFSKPANPEERQVMQLMKELNFITANVPGSTASRVTMRNEIRGMLVEKGVPSFYVTINPADVYNPVVKFLAGDEIDVDKLLPEHVPNYHDQSILVSCNPFVATQFFDLYMRAFVKAILGYDSDIGKTSGGILGHVKSYYGCVKAQGRGTLHCHMLVWVEGGLNPNEIKAKVLANDDVFKTWLVQFLEDTIVTDIPPPPNPSQSVPSSTFHPCSVRGSQVDGTDAEYTSCREQDMHNLVKSGEPKICRFDMDPGNTTPISTFDVDTGELNLRCVNGMVNNFNPTIIEALRCNMDLKFIGSGASPKAILYYITDYITKSPLKTHVAYATLEAALKQVDKLVSTDEPSTTRAKRMLQRCAYALVNQQELSAQQISSYLMEYGDHYTSHEFANLYWPSFERYVQRHDNTTDSVAPEEPNSGEDDDLYEQESNPDLESYDHEEEEAVDPVSAEDEEITLTLDQTLGNLVQTCSQVDNYLYRADALTNVCLWDFIHQLEKTKRRKLSRRSDNERAKQE